MDNGSPSAPGCFAPVFFSTLGAIIVYFYTVFHTLVLLIVGLIFLALGVIPYLIQYRDYRHQLEEYKADKQAKQKEDQLQDFLRSWDELSAEITENQEKRMEGYNEQQAMEYYQSIYMQDNLRRNQQRMKEKEQARAQKETKQEKNVVR